MEFIKQSLKKFLHSRGYEIQLHRIPEEKYLRRQQQQQKLQKNYIDQARLISDRHRQQTAETVAALKQKYENPIVGKVTVWSQVERLAQCVDPTDSKLYCTNQQIHVLQILEGMERDGITDKDLILLALIHDIGKVLLLANEAPENVVDFNVPIGDYPEGVGLDNCIFQWNHDEFGYSRLKDYVPDHLAWLVRYHSIRIDDCLPYMDERDRAYTEKYLRVFAKYDHGTKSFYHLPKKRIEHYRDVIEEAFPQPILI